MHEASIPTYEYIYEYANFDMQSAKDAHLTVDVAQTLPEKDLKKSLIGSKDGSIDVQDLENDSCPMREHGKFTK